jgi:hypothetical protein
MEITELYAAKDVFFDRLGLKENQSRSRPLVYARTAFANAFHKCAGPSKMGSVLGRDHSSVIHYLKSHDKLIRYDDYKDMYNQAVEHRNAITNGDDYLPYLTSKDLLNKVKELREEKRLLQKELDTLYIYKEKFFKLKELL